MNTLTMIDKFKDYWNNYLPLSKRQAILWLIKIEEELKNYQEIKEIAKRFNWDDFTSEIFSVETDKKYRDLFNGAIANIQEDYRKARAFEIVKQYPFEVALVYSQPTYKDYCKWFASLKDGKPILTEEQYNIVRRELKC